MGTSQEYSQEFKESIVQKLLRRSNQTIKEFSVENNIARSTVCRWQSEYANVSSMKNIIHKTNFSSEKILKIISETYSLNEEDVGLYLRKNGLHSSQLIEWRTNILSLMNQPKVNPNKKDERDQKIKDLERNLKKKDAALAEASALLILQKKIHLIWPLPKEDEE